MDTSSEYESNHFNEFYEQHDIVYGETFFFFDIWITSKLDPKANKGEKGKEISSYSSKSNGKGKRKNRIKLLRK